MREVVHSWRRLRASPLFTIFAVASLAIGIGATTAIYSVVRAALAPPPGIRDVEEIVNVSHYPGGSVPIFGISLPDFIDYRARQRTLHHVSAWGQMRQSVTAEGQSYSSFGEIVSGDYFTLLGVAPAAGRLLQPADDAPGATPVAVLNHRVWRHLFQGRTDAIGETVKINGVAFVVAGIAPPEFKGQFNNGLMPTAAWVPLSSAPMFPELGRAEELRGRERRFLRVQGRLAAGRPFEQVRAEVAAIAGQLDLGSPIGKGPASDRSSYNDSRQHWTVQRLADIRLNPAAASLAVGLSFIVLTALGLVLLVACTNLANLMLARASERRHDVAVRRALGASRWRLLRESVIEPAMLVTAGCVFGVLLARALMLSLEVEIGNGGSLVLDPQIDLAVLAVSAGATLLALVTAGLVPAWLSTRADVRGTLAAAGSTTLAPRWRGRRLLITGQVAVSVILLAVTTLFTSQLRAQARIDTGIDLDRLAVAQVDFTMQRVDELRTREIVARVLAALARNPGVEAAAISSGLPVGVMTPGAGLTGPDGKMVSSGFMAATPGIFRTLGVSITAGRAFDDRDRAGGEPVIVMNETAARSLFGDTNVVGQTVTVTRRRWVGEDPHTPRDRVVIGIASDSDSGSAGRREEGVIYLPWDQQYEGRLVLSARAKGDPEALIGALRQSLAATDPGVAIAQLGTGLAVAGPSMTFAQIAAGLAGTLGGFGLLLALAGLFGVMSHVVSRRTREIGVRLALGASPSGIQGLILREGLSPVVVGIVAGGALAAIVRMSLQPMFERLVPATDFLALAFVPALLLLAGAVAAILPARRASRVNPNVALRDL